MSGATIGPADGITYVVVNPREETKPAIACGFNDVGSPNPGIFSVETRNYTEYQKGTLIRSWQEDVSTFSRCAGD